MTPGRLGRFPDLETPDAAAAYPVSEHAGYKLSTRTYRYWSEVTRLNQGDTGTCVANALAHRRANGPVVVSGIDEYWARTLYLEATGDISLDQGTSALTVCRRMLQRGDITAYHWVTSPGEFNNAMLEQGSLCIGIDWYSSFDDPILRSDGRHWIKLDRGSGIRGGHEVNVNGIRTDAPVPYARILNSWGPTYGDAGTVRLALTDLYEVVFNENGDCVLVTEV